MKSTPLIATVALAIAAIYLGESFKSVDSGLPRCIKKLFGMKTKSAAAHEPTSTTNRDVCAECGLYDDEKFTSTALVVRRTGDARSPQYALAVVIGKRFALSSGEYNFWDAYLDCRVYYSDGEKLTASEKAPYTTIVKVDKFHVKDMLVLITLNDDIPSHVVPACLPLPGKIQVTKGEEFKIPYIYEADYSGAAFAITLTLRHEGKYMVVETQKPATEFHLQLEPYASFAESNAIGGAVTKEIDGRLVLLAITEYFKSENKRQENILNVITIYEQKTLDFIAKHAKDVGQSVCTISPKPLADDKPKAHWTTRFNPKRHFGSK